MSHPSNNVDLQTVDEVFAFIVPSPGQAFRCRGILESGRRLSLAVIENCPPCADRSAALRKIREAIMTANAAIMLEPEKTI